MRTVPAIIVSVFALVYLTIVTSVVATYVQPAIDIDVINRCASYSGIGFLIVILLSMLASYFSKQLGLHLKTPPVNNARLWLLVFNIVLIVLIFCEGSNTIYIRDRSLFVRTAHFDSRNVGIPEFIQFGWQEIRRNLEMTMVVLNIAMGSIVFKRNKSLRKPLY